MLNGCIITLFVLVVSLLTARARPNSPDFTHKTEALHLCSKSPYPERKPLYSPFGYTLKQVNHIGCHGSRYLQSIQSVACLKRALQNIKNHFCPKLFSATGEQWLQRMEELISECNVVSVTEHITKKGQQEQEAIAQRLMQAINADSTTPNTCWDIYTFHSEKLKTYESQEAFLTSLHTYKPLTSSFKIHKMQSNRIRWTVSKKKFHKFHGPTVANEQHLPASFRHLVSRDNFREICRPMFRAGCKISDNQYIHVLRLMHIGCQYDMNLPVYSRLGLCQYISNTATSTPINPYSGKKTSITKKQRQVALQILTHFLAQEKKMMAQANPALSLCFCNDSHLHPFMEMVGILSPNTPDYYTMSANLQCRTYCYSGKSSSIHNKATSQYEPQYFVQILWNEEPITIPRLDGGNYQQLYPWSSVIAHFSYLLKSQK